jgi:hypothetical protein
MTLYNYEKSVKAAEKRIQTATYSEINKNLILKFENTLYAEGISSARVLKYLNQLNRIDRTRSRQIPIICRKIIHALFSRTFNKNGT